MNTYGSHNEDDKNINIDDDDDDDDDENNNDINYNNIIIDSAQKRNGDGT